ncbi:MAG: YafY family protein [Bacillota bacterium]|jgi:predicted DNA-binding transcriptional regulator YafY
MKIDRLVAITTILLNKGPVTAKELAERFEVSSRTIYRDIEVLAAAGVPVYATKGNGGGIALMEGFSLDRAALTSRESESILLALQTLRVVKYPEVDLILDKLGALFKNVAGTDWVEVDFSPWGSGPEEKLKFQTIRKGILERQKLEFTYLGADGKRSHRIVEPLKLFFKAKAWYLWAWCQTRQALRNFKITRMREVVLTEQKFERQAHALKITDPAENPPAAKTMVNLKLRFQPLAGYRLYDDYDERLIRRNEDGTFELQICFPEDEWVYGYLLSFGPWVEVLEPEHIRAILCERMRQALQVYERQK